MNSSDASMRVSRSMFSVSSRRGRKWHPVRRLVNTGDFAVPAGAVTEVHPHNYDHAALTLVVGRDETEDRRPVFRSRVDRLPRMILRAFLQSAFGEPQRAAILEPIHDSLRL